MWASNYFAPHYYPRNYFPGTIAEKARYFYHGALPLSFFADAYFPGDLVAIIEPEPEPEPTPIPAFGGGRPYPQPRFAPAIHGRADLTLPTLRFSAFGFVTPANIEARLEAELARLTFSASGHAVPANIKGEPWHGLSLPGFTLSVDGTVTTVRLLRAKSRSQRELDEEEQLLLEHYLLTLKGTD